MCRETLLKKLKNSRVSRGAHKKGTVETARGLSTVRGLPSVLRADTEGRPCRSSKPEGRPWLSTVVVCEPANHL